MMWDYQATLKQAERAVRRRVNIERTAYHIGRVLFWTAAAGAILMILLGLAALVGWLVTTYLWQALITIFLVFGFSCVVVYYNERWPMDPNHQPSSPPGTPDVEPPSR